MPVRYERGTLNYPGIASLYVGIGFFREIGIPVISDQAMNMSHHLFQIMSEEPNITIHAPIPSSLLFPSISKVSKAMMQGLSFHECMVWLFGQVFIVHR